MTASRRVTLKDVAARAGAHVGTVSKALNESTRGQLNSRTVERVLDAASELGYTPNVAARSLRTSRTATIGIVVPDIVNPYFAAILRSIDDVLFDAGYAALILNSDNDRARERVAIETLYSRQVDGIVVATAASDQVLLGEIERSGLPFVTINRAVHQIAASSVRSDDSAGIADVVDHLVDLGHRELAEIRGPVEFQTSVVRAESFGRTLADRGVPSPRPGWSIRAAAYTVDEGRRCAGDILDIGIPTAIVAANDLLAIGALVTLRERGLRCPSDVSVTGFNNMMLADQLTPALTTVDVNSKELGAIAARLMLNSLDGSGAPAQHTVLPVKLVVRDSSAPPVR